MNYVPAFFDLAVIVAAVLAFGLEATLLPRLKEAIARSGERIRLRAYWWQTTSLWAVCLAVLGGWIVLGRPWSALFLGQTESWRLLAGFALAALIVFLNFRARCKLLTRQDVLERHRPMLESIGYLMPRSPREVLWWTVLSITAGITEEVLCRGYVLSLVAQYTWLWVAAPASAMLFGLGHSYQGVNGVVRTTIFGVVASLIVLISGSLLPAIILHAVIDLVSGDLGRRVVTESQSV